MAKHQAKGYLRGIRAPIQLIGIEGSQTYANHEQARAAFYEDRAIPLLDKFLAALNKWLGLRAGLRPDDVFCVDIDAVAALEPRRAERNQVLDKIQSITINENVQRWAMMRLMVAMVF